MKTLQDIELYLKYNGILYSFSSCRDMTDITSFGSRTQEIMLGARVFDLRILIPYTKMLRHIDTYLAEYKSIVVLSCNMSSSGLVEINMRFTEDEFVFDHVLEFIRSITVQKEKIEVSSFGFLEL